MEMPASGVRWITGLVLMTLPAFARLQLPRRPLARTRLGRDCGAAPCVLGTLTLERDPAMRHHFVFRGGGRRAADRVRRDGHHGSGPTPFGLRSPWRRLRASPDCSFAVGSLVTCESRVCRPDVEADHYVGGCACRRAGPVRCRGLVIARLPRSSTLIGYCAAAGRRSEGTPQVRPAHLATCGRDPLRASGRPNGQQLMDTVE